MTDRIHLEDTAMPQPTTCPSRYASTTGPCCPHPTAEHRARDGWCLHVDCHCVGTTAPAADGAPYDAGDAPPLHAAHPTTTLGLAETLIELAETRASRDQWIRLQVDTKAALVDALAELDDLRAIRAAVDVALATAGHTSAVHGPPILIANLRAERDAARRERDEALDEIGAVWAALNAAGIQGPCSAADLVARLARDRDRYADVVTAARAWRDARADRHTTGGQYHQVCRALDAAVTDQPTSPDTTAGDDLIAAVTTWREARGPWLLDDPDRRATPEELALIEVYDQWAAARPAGTGDGEPS